MEEKSTDKGKKWAFTLNNFSVKEREFLEQLSCNFIKFGEEVGESGTNHLQGFVIFKTDYRRSGLKKLNQRISWRLCKGSDEQNLNYVSKDMTNIFERDYRSQGKRTDLLALAKAVADGGVKKVVEEMPDMYIKFHAGIDKLAWRLQKPREDPPIVTWIYGETGKGKTRSVFELHDISNIWISGKNLQWWDGYENQEVVLIDDFRRDFCTFHELLRILDRYPYKVAIKGGFRELNSKYIYITSPFSPGETYETREDLEQLTRRITKIIKA